MTSLLPKGVLQEGQLLQQAERDVLHIVARQHA